MADYIKLRLAAARVGVSMAFFALLAGVAERAHAATQPPPPANFLREVFVPSGKGLNRVILKLDSALATLEHKLSTNFDTTHKLDQTFLKIKSAGTEFLKIKSANASFLKIDDANANFLKIDDASKEFLKIDSTAANASELGGLTPDAFFQGNGHVITGSVVASTGAGPQQLLSLPGGIIVVSVTNTPGAGLQLTIHNASGVNLPAVQDVAAAGNSTTGATTLVTGQDAAIGLDGAGAQVHVQIFPSGAAFPEVVTLIVSADGTTVVGQAFTGGV